MNSLVLRNQIIFMLLTIMLVIFCVTGISFARHLVNNISLTIETSRLIRPIDQYYNYRLSLAESQNKTILESIISPKKEEAKSTTMISSIPVVVYHGIVEEADGENATLDQIKTQLYTLKEAGYSTVSLEDYLLFTQGKKELPAKSFLLTFDDGRKDSYEGIDPVLRALNYQATMFVITAHLNENKSSFYLSVNELKSMQKSDRWSIQSHGKNAHEQYPIDDKGTTGAYYANKLWLAEENRLETTEEFKARVQKDLSDSKADLEALEFKVNTFAFPFGDYGQFSKNFPEAAELVPVIAHDIFTISFYQTYKKSDDNFTTQNYFGEQKAFSKRLTIKPELSGEAVTNVLESGNKKSLPYTEDFSNPKDWHNSWGLMSIDQNELMIGSTPDTTGGSAFLKAAEDWTNYKVDASVTFLMGNTFSLHARVLNEQNYLTCDFSDSQVQIEQKINGESTVIIKKKLIKPFDPANTKFSLSVKSQDISCKINDEEVLKTTKTKKLNPSIVKGTIGFSTWDPQKGNSAILVNNLTVSELQ